MGSKPHHTFADRRVLGRMPPIGRQPAHREGAVAHAGHYFFLYQPGFCLGGNAALAGYAGGKLWRVKKTQIAKARNLQPRQALPRPFKQGTQAAARWQCGNSSAQGIAALRTVGGQGRIRKTGIVTAALKQGCRGPVWGAGSGKTSENCSGQAVMSCGASGS